MNLFSRKPKRKKIHSTTSSKGWRELKSSTVWPVLNAAGIDTKGVKEMFLLTFAIDTESARSEAIQTIKEEDWKKLSILHHNLPIDYDETDYDTIEVVYIHLESGCFLYLFTIDKDYPKATLLDKFLVSQLDLNTFPGKMSIYPV